MIRPDMRRVVTLMRPWPFLVIRPDLAEGSQEREDWINSPFRKDVENRGWKFGYTGRLYIHAGRTFDKEAWRGLMDAFPELRPALWKCLPCEQWDQASGIIGRVEMWGCVRHWESQWFSGPFGWLIKDPVAMPFEAMPGKQGVWFAGDSIKL